VLESLVFDVTLTNEDKGRQIGASVTTFGQAS